MEQRVEVKQEQFWAILELMGHVRLAGLVSEEMKFGVVMGRIDIPREADALNGAFTTQFFGGSSVYRLTPTTEEIARSIAKANQPNPAHRWELPQLESGSGDTEPDADEQDFDSKELPF